MDFVVEGIVVEGDHRGRELGYPTANVQDLPDVELPDDGVYAGTAELANGERYLAAISVGTRATFYGTQGARLVEAFLLDFDGDLYGQRLRVTLVELVRPQERFDDVDALIDQIRADVSGVRELLESRELTRSE
jgi:riboflavin kinase / FMN adenylyltransferase